MISGVQESISGTLHVRCRSTAREAGLRWFGLVQRTESATDTVERHQCWKWRTGGNEEEQRDFWI